MSSYEHVQESDWVVAHVPSRLHCRVILPEYPEGQFRNAVEPPTVWGQLYPPMVLAGQGLAINVTQKPTLDI